MSGRVNSVDALRAFALAGIAVVNMPFLAGPFGDLPHTGRADDVAAFVIAALFAGKFFLLFAFLFGWGVGVQKSSAARAGARFAPRFLRRQLGLLLIGAAHAMLVFVGDILITYALVGMLLFAVRGIGNRHLMELSGVAILGGAASLAVVAILATDMGTPTAVAGAGYLGSFGDAVGARAHDFGSAFPFILLFNGPLVFAAFCAGLVAARTDFLTPGNPLFDRMAHHRFALLAAGAVANVPFAAVASGWTYAPVADLIAVMSLAVAAPLLSLAYLLIVVRWAASRRTGWLTAAGRMSLTGYVLEGVVGGLIFNGYGLGYFGQFGVATVTLIAIAVFLTVEAICALWSRVFGQGPLERLLRALTYRPTRTPVTGAD